MIPSNGRMLTASSFFALAISSHCRSSSSHASRVRSVGSTSHRYGVQLLPPGPVDAVAERDGPGSEAVAHRVDERLHLGGLAIEDLALG